MRYQDKDSFTAQQFGRSTSNASDGCLPIILGLILLAGIAWIIYDVATTPRTATHGFIVAKEYIPSHMSNASARPVQEAIIVPVFHPTPPPAPHRVASSWTVWLANRYGSYPVAIDSGRYVRLRVGQRWATVLN